MYKLILTFLVLFLISCSSNDTIEYDLEQSFYENNNYKDYELFDRANKFIVSKQFDLALIELDKIEVLYPTSPYANRGMLVNAYIHFLKKDYEKTRALAENYKKYYPGGNNMAYANYLEAMTYYVLIKKPNYSQTNSYKALDKFNFILNAYPNSDYEIDIITKIQILQNNLAANKLNIAKFYLNKKNSNAALLYLLDNFKNHNNTNSIQETLYHITKIYKNLEEIELSKKYAAILAYNFPDSHWYEKSFNLINDIEIKKNKNDWFNRFNPIKIILRDITEDVEIKKID